MKNSKSSYQTFFSFISIIQKKNDTVNSSGDRNIVGRNVSGVEYVNGDATASVLLDRIAALEKQLAEKDAQIARLLKLLERD